MFFYKQTKITTSFQAHILIRITIFNIVQETEMDVGL